MNSVVSTALPLFAMILVGYLAVRFRVLTPESTKGLVATVFWIFLPFFIYTKMTDVDASTAVTGMQVLAPYYFAAAIVLVISVLSASVFWHYDSKSLTIRGLASISGVVGYMGLPLILIVLGPKATLPTIALVTADNLVILAGGSLTMEFLEHRQNEGRVLTWRFVSKTIVAIAKNPLLVAVGAGVLSLSFGWKAPGPLYFFAQQFTAAAGPCALVALGAALASQQGRHATRQNRTDIGGLVVLKVIIFPLLVYLFGTFAFALPSLILQVAVLMAALPVAVNVFIMAARYGAYVEQSSRAMLFSTILSVFVISSLLVLMGH